MQNRPLISEGSPPYSQIAQQTCEVRYKRKDSCRSSQAQKELPNQPVNQISAKGTTKRLPQMIPHLSRINTKKAISTHYPLIAALKPSIVNIHLEKLFGHANA
jgi:hypothetical protein